MKMHALVWPNRAAHPAQEDIIERTYPFLDDVWTGPRAEGWYLEALAIHPDFQGQGHGNALVKWGLQQAEREGICASVISAYGKDGFYKKCGFDVQDGHAGMGEENPLHDIKGGNIWWRLPRAKE